MKQVKVGALTYAQLILHMLEGVHDCRALAELTGLHYVTVLQYTRELHAAKAAHICAWDKDGRGRDSIKIYKIGTGRDAPRARKTPGQRSQTYRARVRHADMLHRLAGNVQSKIA